MVEGSGRAGSGGRGVRRKEGRREAVVASGLGQLLHHCCASEH